MFFGDSMDFQKNQVKSLTLVNWKSPGAAQAQVTDIEAGKVKYAPTAWRKFLPLGNSVLMVWPDVGVQLWKSGRGQRDKAPEQVLFLIRLHALLDLNLCKYAQGLPILDIGTCHFCGQDGFDIHSCPVCNCCGHQQCFDKLQREYVYLNSFGACVKFPPFESLPPSFEDLLTVNAGLCALCLRSAALAVADVADGGEVF